MILYSISLLLGIYFGASAFYMLFFALAAKIPNFKKPQKATKNRRFAVFIPAYKEDEVIVQVAQDALHQHYPRTAFEVIVIADSLQKKTLTQLYQLPIRVIEVSFEKSTKSKALNAAIQQLNAQDYDLALVLDADNVMEPDFLTKINDFFTPKRQIVQARRIAKNLDSPFAILDAISEAINNNIYNLGHQRLGLSARLVGSGMTFDYRLFEQMMKEVDAVGGFDKELELRLLERGIPIYYRHNALVYDEKVSKAQVFGNQRKRWIAAQFHYLKKYFGKAFWALISKGKLDFFNKAYQMALPPRLLIPGVLLIGFALNYLLLPALSTFWGLALAANILANLIAMPRQFYNRRSLAAFAQLPKAFWLIIQAVFRLKGANKQFIHTPHTAKTEQS